MALAVKEPRIGKIPDKPVVKGAKIGEKPVLLKKKPLFYGMVQFGSLQRDLQAQNRQPAHCARGLGDTYRQRNCESVLAKGTSLTREPCEGDPPETSVDWWESLETVSIHNHVVLPLSVDGKKERLSRSPLVCSETFHCSFLIVVRLVQNKVQRTRTRTAIWLKSLSD